MFSDIQCKGLSLSWESFICFSAKQWHVMSTNTQTSQPESLKMTWGDASWFLRIPSTAVTSLMNNTGHEYALRRYQQNDLRSFLQPNWLFETHNHRARPIVAVFSFVKFRSSLNCLLRHVVQMCIAVFVFATWNLPGLLHLMSNIALVCIDIFPVRHTRGKMSALCLRM